MTSCVIRYRLDRPGPSAMLLNCGGQARMQARDDVPGGTGRSRLLAILAESELRWIPASGAVTIEAEERLLLEALPPARRPVVRTIPA